MAQEDEVSDAQVDELIAGAEGCYTDHKLAMIALREHSAACVIERFRSQVAGVIEHAPRGIPWSDILAAAGLNKHQRVILAQIRRHPRMNTHQLAHTVLHVHHQSLYRTLRRIRQRIMACREAFEQDIPSESAFSLFDHSGAKTHHGWAGWPSGVDWERWGQGPGG